MARVVWPDTAVRQSDGIVARIELFNPAAARRTADRLFVAGESLASFPNRGRPAPHGARALTTVAPYIMSDAVHGAVVTIVGVRHSAQRPTAYLATP